MKRKIFIFSTVLLTAVLTSFTNLQAQRQIISGTTSGIKASAVLNCNQSELQASSKTTPLTELTTKKPVYVHFTCGLGSSTQAACESAYTFFAQDGSTFKKDTQLFWDPSLTTPVTWGTVIVYHADNSIWGFNSGTSSVGNSTGNYCQ